MNELVEAHLEPVPYGKQSKERLGAYTKEVWLGLWFIAVTPMH